MKRYLLLVLCLPLIISTPILAESFGDYWNQGKAEIVTYDLVQSRYGQQRKGHAVAVWVTEDFSTHSQVKLDNPQSVSADEKAKVLKINLVRRFTTGIYDYSIMRSTFMPLDLNKYQYPLKTTLSAQDWCGQSFLQVNDLGEKFSLRSHSYFESEGDVNRRVGAAYSEDQIWSQIRIAPKLLPTGKVSFYPSASYTVLEHKPYQASAATASLSKKGKELQYTLLFPELDRKVVWNIKNESPYVLTSWEEHYRSASGRNVKNIGTLRTLKQSDYWNRNSTGDDSLRDQLGLPSFGKQ